MKVLTDKEVGELWRRCLPGSGVSAPVEEKVILLIYKLVEERAEVYLAKYRLTSRVTSERLALDDFGIDVRTKHLKHLLGGLEEAHGSD